MSIDSYKQVVPGIIGQLSDLRPVLFGFWNQSALPTGPENPNPNEKYGLRIRGGNGIK